jgi:DIS3-like exonuclease 1
MYDMPETDYQSLVTAGSANSRPVGRVVGIQQRNWRSYVATIQEEGAEQGGTMHIAIPLDPVIPKIRIRHSDVNLIRNQRIVVRIDSWYTFFHIGFAS